MTRRRETSRVTRPGTSAPAGGSPTGGPPELPGIRKRRPLLFWGLMVALIGLLLPFLLTILQALS